MRQAAERAQAEQQAVTDARKQQLQHHAQSEQITKSSQTQSKPVPVVSSVDVSSTSSKSATSSTAKQQSVKSHAIQQPTSTARRAVAAGSDIAPLIQQLREIIPDLGDEAAFIALADHNFDVSATIQSIIEQGEVNRSSEELNSNEDGSQITTATTVVTAVSNAQPLSHRVEGMFCCIIVNAMCVCDFCITN